MTLSITHSVGHCTDGHVLVIVMLNVIMLNFTLLSVVMLNVIMLNVVMLSVAMLNVIVSIVVAPDFVATKTLFRRRCSNFSAGTVESSDCRLLERRRRYDASAALKRTTFGRPGMALTGGVLSKVLPYPEILD
jgi:hypothetical protein